MTIKDEKTYNEIEERMETLLAKGTQLGGMDFLSEVEKEELKVLSEAAYDWECEVDPHPWRVKPSLIAAIKVAFRQKGYKQKEAAKAIGVSTTALSDILHGRRAINFDVARNIYHNLGVPACGIGIKQQPPAYFLKRAGGLYFPGILPCSRFRESIYNA